MKGRKKKRKEKKKKKTKRSDFLLFLPLSLFCLKNCAVPPRTFSPFYLKKGWGRKVGFPIYAQLRGSINCRCLLFVGCKNVIIRKV